MKGWPPCILIALSVVGCVKPPARRPMLSIFTRAAGPPPNAETQSVALVLGGTPELEADALRDDVQAVERQAFPLDLGVDEPDPTALRRHMPAFTAAASLGASRWNAPNLEVRLGPGCEPGADRCAPAMRGDEGDPTIRRARGMAWAVSHAAIVVPSNADVVDRLVTRTTDPASTVALVFRASQGTIDGARLKPLEAEAARALRHLGPRNPARAWLEEMSAASGSWTLPITLQPEEVLVVPRMGAIARLADFRSEVSSAGSLTWIVEPQP